MSSFGHPKDKEYDSSSNLFEKLTRRFRKGGHVNVLERRHRLVQVSSRESEAIPTSEFKMPNRKTATWNPKQLETNGCSNMAIEILYIGNGCLGKHPFLSGCLGFHVFIIFHSPPCCPESL